MSMEELASLAKTAGAEVVANIPKNVNAYDSKSFVGSGKLEEIKAMVDADEITTVIVNNRLTPRQNTNLEAAFGVKVIDRMQLILDIFAMGARSHEGKLPGSPSSTKIHVAPFSWSRDYAQSSSRGIGSRGPGESQLELNRRSIRTRLTDIERQLRLLRRTEKPFAKSVLIQLPLKLV